LARERPWAVPLLAVAANAPDFESLIPAGSTANYLLYHRGLSHSVVGVFVEALLLTLATLAILKFWRGRKKDSTPLPKALTVFVIAWLGAASHILLDWFNSYGVWPWRPFSDAVYYGDFVFIIDPWFWLLLGAGCYLAAPKGLGTSVLYIVIFGLMFAVLLYAMVHGMLPEDMIWSWLVLAGAVELLKSKIDHGWFVRWSPCCIAQVALLALVGYLGGLYACSQRARELVSAQFYEIPPKYISAHPTPGTPWRFTVLADFDAMVQRYEVDVWTKKIVRRTDFITNRDDPVIAAIRETQEYRAWMYFARHRVALREGNTLVLGDARYRIWDGRPDWTEMRVPLPRPQLGPQTSPKIKAEAE
jgi:inner membrane protein